MFCWKVAISEKVQSAFGPKTNKKQKYEIFHNVDINLSASKTTDCGLPGVNYEFTIFDATSMVKKLDNAQISSISAYTMTVMGLVPNYSTNALQYKLVYCYCWIYEPKEQDEKRKIRH